MASISCSDDDIDRFLKVLSQEETARIKRYRIADDRRRSILGRGVARGVLARYLHTCPEEISFETSPKGKSTLSGDHVDTGIVFSIAHSGDCILVAFARDTLLGVDVESTERQVEYEKLSRRYFAPVEAEELASLPAEQQHAAFLRCWTQKEAYLKAQGTGLSLSLDSFTVSVFPEEPCALRWVKDQPDEAARWTIAQLDPETAHTGAVAFRARGWPVQCWDIRDQPASTLAGK